MSDSAILLNSESALDKNNSRSLSESIGLAVLLGLTAYLFCLSCYFSIHQYDSFEYLNNANQMVGIKTRYDLARPPFFTLLLWPLAWLAKITGQFAVIDQGPYLLMTLLGCLTLLLSWYLFRKDLPPVLAIMAVVTMAFNGLYLHYWSFLMPEVPASLLLLLFWWSMFQRNYWLAGVILGAILNLRYQFFLLAFISLIYLYLCAYSNWRQYLIDSVKLAVASAVVLLGAHVIVCLVGNPELSLSANFQEIARRLGQLNSFTQTQAEPLLNRLLVELDNLTHFLSLPVALIALLGVFVAIKRRRAQDIAWLLTFLVLFFNLALMMPVIWKQSRYQIPTLISCYYFFALGLELIWQQLDRLMATAPQLLRAFLLGLFAFSIAITPINSAYQELARLHDPSYFKPVAQDLCQFVKSRATTGQKIYWAGNYLTIAPSSFLYSAPEKFFFFNYFTNALSFYTGQLCYSNFSEEFVYQNNNGSLVVINQNPCKDFIELSEIQIKPIPLTVHRIEQQEKLRFNGEKVTREIAGTTVEFAVFVSDDKQREIYLGEVGNRLLLASQQRQDNIIVQIGYRNERVPQFLDQTIFALPNQLPRTARVNLNNIDFIMVTTLSAPASDLPNLLE